MTGIRRVMLWCFDRLYNEASWAYDLAAVVAGGKYWYRWGHAAIPFVQPGPVLEVGVGQGRLLPALADAGHGPLFCADLSLAMLRRTRTTLRATATPAALLRANGVMLPFPDQSFGTLITVFPAPYVTQRQTQQEFARVLQPGGRWLWVDAPRGHGPPSWEGGLTTLLGQPPSEALEALEATERQLFLHDASGAFDLTLARVPIDHTSILVRLATKR